VERILDESGTGLDFNALLIFAAVIGFGGALVSAALSKWTAKRFTGARVIERPSSETEAWLLETVRRQAKQVECRADGTGRRFPAMARSAMVK
jgi:heat shock protein HtpX